MENIKNSLKILVIVRKFTGAPAALELLAQSQDIGMSLRQRNFISMAEVSPEMRNYPVVGVSWFEAMAYCSWLSYKTGKTFRLPTEAEWEKAARGTKQFRYSWGNYIDSSYANYWSFEDSGEKGISPVGYYDGSLQGNFKTSDGSSPYGTYDMTGNVWEWCSDWFSDTYFETSPTNNPTGPPSGPTKIKRGGSWIHIPEIQRSALRTSDGPMDRIEDLGFRCVQSISDKFDIESMFTFKTVYCRTELSQSF